MNLVRLRNMRDNLSKKVNKSKEDEELLKELISLGKILDRTEFSLSLSSDICPSCGKRLK